VTYAKRKGSRPRVLKVIDEPDPTVRTLVPNRPNTRAECPPKDHEGRRRCPYVGCRHHLYLEAMPPTSLGKKRMLINWPDIDPTELPETCSLDVAEQGGLTLDEVGQLLNICRERTRQCELEAKENIARRHPELAKLIEEEKEDERTGRVGGTWGRGWG